MKNIFRYSGIAAITFSLFMLSLGSMPTSDAGQVASQLTVTLSCGLVVANGQINWDDNLNPNTGNTLDSTVAGDYSGAQPSVSNPIANTADSSVSANVGDNTSGGYAGTIDATTHIQPTEISIDLLVDSPPAAPVAMSNAAANIFIGLLSPNEAQTLQLVVNSNNIQGQPITDLTWALTINLSALCEFN